MNACLHERRMRMNVEGDRLSILPDDLIYKILSFVDIRDAIGTSALSSRWRFIWTLMPYLNISADGFPRKSMFFKFAANVLSHRNNLAQVYSLKLSFRVKASFAVVKRILKYAFSHNIQHLEVICEIANDIEFPLSLFSSQTLKHLSLTMRHKRHKPDYFRRSLTSTWQLPTLTTLVLDRVILCVDGDELFSKCVNLKNLTLINVTTNASKGFSLNHPQLSSLTINRCPNIVKGYNVVAPQLKNLILKFCLAEPAIYAPGLTSLVYHSYYPLALYTEGFHSLEKADICLLQQKDKDVPQIVSLLQLLHNVQFLTLNLETIEVLSSSADIILPKHSPFVNLKSLNIYPEIVYFEWKTPMKDMSTKLKSYLLDGSPGSAFTIVLREEIRAKKMMAGHG